MAIYRVDWTQEMYCHIDAKSPEEAVKMFWDEFDNGILDSHVNEYAPPSKMEVVGPNGSITTPKEK